VASKSTRPRARPARASAQEDRILSIDIGGSGLKAGVVDPEGSLVGERVRVPTPYPCPPSVLVSSLVALIRDLPPAPRVAVGFPGMVRDGRVLEVPSLSRRVKNGPRDPGLAALWRGHPLARKLEQRLKRPVRLANDADVQGTAVVSGQGMEFVLTLGTGVGTALFHHGRLLPHLELSHAPLRKGATIDVLLGEASRKRHGTKRWSRWVHEAIAHFDEMLFFDRLYLGGGNSGRVRGALDPRVEIVSNLAGILGGASLWKQV
jgi:polyphosphate glucokinase